MALSDKSVFGFYDEIDQTLRDEYLFDDGLALEEFLRARLGLGPLQHLGLGQVRRHAEVVAHFPVHLDGIFDLALPQHRRVGFGPEVGRQGQRTGVPQLLPEFLGHVRGEREEHLHERLDGEPGLGGFPLGFVQPVEHVHQFHQRRDRRVESEIFFDVARNPRDGLMGLDLQFVEARVGGGAGLRGARQLVRQSPDPVEEAPHAFDALRRPFELGPRRRGEQDEHPAGVHPEPLDDFRRFHHVALGFGHGRTAQGDHPLRQQVGERFVARQQSLVAQDLVEKTGIDEVHAGVLDAPDVLVHRQPGVRLAGIERPVGVLRVEIAGVIPGRVHERVHGVRLAPGFPPARRTHGLNERVGLGQRGFPFAGELDRIRQADGQVFLGDRHGAARRAVDDRDRRSPVPLPAQEPVAQFEGDRLRADLPPFKVRGDLFLGRVGGQTVVRSGVDQDPVGLVRFR